MIRRAIIFGIGLFMAACGGNGNSPLLISQAHGADLNGYTALYECKSGGAHCDVDVTTYVTHACDQTITTSDGSWSAITWSNQYICIEPGDYTSWGTLTIGGSGSAGNYKVVRCIQSDTSACDDPWTVAAASTVRISKIVSSSKSFYILYQLTSVQTASTDKMSFTSDSNVILDSVLVEGAGGTGDNSNIFTTGTTDFTLQHSVSRNCQITVGRTYEGIGINAATRLHVVNNEIYNCQKEIHHNTTTNDSDVVIENNDLYITSAYYYDGSGNQDSNGDYAAIKVLVSPGAGGTSGHPEILLHNRIWGGRKTDTNAAASGGGAAGYAIDANFNVGADWIEVINNIISDSNGGISLMSGTSGQSSTNNSVIGNLIYNVFENPSAAAGEGIAHYAANGGTTLNHEQYLNTVIKADHAATISSVTNDDMRCNVFIDNGAFTAFTGSGAQLDYNAFYGTTESTTESPDHDVGNLTLNTRANSTVYANGDLMRTDSDGSGCTVDTDSACDIYKQVSGGSCTSAGSSPTFRTKLNSKTVDNDCVWLAIRSAYKFYRKLKTQASGEAAYIPYARVLNTSDSPSHSLCPSNYASRTGIGIDDSSDPGATRLIQ